MERKIEEKIMSASRPEDIFSMNPDTIEQEKEEYIERFKPQSYSTIKNFVITQKVITLYRRALLKFDNMDNEELSNLSLYISEMTGCMDYHFECHYVYDIRIGKMYVTENKVIFVIDKEYKKYYENYIEKTKKFPKVNKDVWESVQYTLPKVVKNFQSTDEKWVIILKMPCSRIYPLREILNFYDGKLEPEYVASMLTRLYNFVCYMDLNGMNHNGITIDNLFFAPGRVVEEGESYTVDDVRFVGVFGGWFYTTWTDEKIKGIPKEVYEIIPQECKKTGFSSFALDSQSVKRVARELLGDDSGENLISVPMPLKSWVNDSTSEKNAYEEFCKWERVIIDSFGKKRFVEIDVSIN